MKKHLSRTFVFLLFAAVFIFGRAERFISYSDIFSGAAGRALNEPSSPRAELPSLPAVGDKVLSLYVTSETEPKSSPPREPYEAHIPVRTTLSLTLAGDCTLGYDEDYDREWRFDTMAKSVKDYAYFLGGVQSYFSADDLTIINLEGPLTESRDIQLKLFNFKGSPEYIEILTAGSVEAVSFGNNHSRDYGEKGHYDTLSLLEENGITYSYDATAGIRTVRGVRIGFISVNEHYDKEKVENFIIEAMAFLRERAVDSIIVSCHWGEEGTTVLTDYQKKLSHKIIDWGADLVIGHHPHILQAIEIYKGRCIFYSLANFCFGGNMNPKNKDTALVSFKMSFTDGAYAGFTAKLVPCSVSSVKWRNDYRPTLLGAEARKRVINNMAELSAAFGVTLDADGNISLK